MATINPGNYNNQNITGGSRAREHKQQDAPSFQVEDGLVLSGQLPPGVPDLGPASLPGPATELPVNIPMEVKTPVETSTRVSIPSEFGGAFLTGPGLTTGIQAVNPTANTAGVSEFAFTNGLHSRQIIGLSGNVLADANPFK